MMKPYLDLAQTMASIGLSAPQVIAARGTRLAQPGALLRRKEQAEFVRMVSEKQLAFIESSWQAYAALWAHNQSAMLGLWSAWAKGAYAAPWPQNPALWSKQGADLLNRSLKPYQKKARSNARRLRKPL